MGHFVSDRGNTESSFVFLSGVIFSLVQILIFFSFIIVCVFDSGLLSKNFMGTGIPVSFVMGFLVILCGLILTIMYVFITNRKEGG